MVKSIILIYIFHSFAAHSLCVTCVYIRLSISCMLFLHARPNSVRISLQRYSTLTLSSFNQSQQKSSATYIHIQRHNYRGKKLHAYFICLTCSIFKLFGDRFSLKEEQIHSWLDHELKKLWARKSDEFCENETCRRP